MAKKKPSDDYVPEPFSFGKAKGKLSDYAKQLADQDVAADREIRKLCKRLTGLPYTHQRLADLLIVECGLPATHVARYSADEIRSALQAYAAAESSKRTAAPRPWPHEAIAKALHDYLTANEGQLDSKGRTFKKKSLYIQACVSVLNDGRFASYRRQFDLKTEEGKKKAANWVREKVRYFEETRNL